MSDKGKNKVFISENSDQLKHDKSEVFSRI